MTDIDLQSRPPRGGSIQAGLPAYAGILALFAFVGWLDFNLPLGLTVWLLYLAPIWLTSRIVPFDHRLVIGGAVTTMGLVATSFFFSPEGGPSWI
jgi:hypothetical protein